LERTSPPQLVDHETSEFVFLCAWYFTITAAGEGIEVTVRGLE